METIAFDRHIETLNHELNKYHKWELELLIKASNQTIRRKYAPKRKTVRYKGLNKGLKKDELKNFFSNINCPHLKTKFLLQFFLGLRISEIETLKVDYNKDLIIIDNVKCDRKDYIPLFEPVRTILKENYPIKSNSMGVLRKRLREAANRAGLNFIYDKATNGRNLYLFSSHSLRHSAITIFGDYIKDPFKLCHFSRHETKSVVGVQAIYRYYDIEELRTDLENCFKEYIFLKRL